MLLVTSLVLILFAVKRSEQYKMDVLSRNPLAGAGILPEKIRNMVIEFESRRTATLHPTEARVSHKQANELCDAFTDDEDTINAIRGKRSFHFIPVSPGLGEDEDDMPTFKDPCFGWIRKSCAGRPKPPFDYRCHYWVPYYVFAGPECSEGTDPANRIQIRRKRLAHSIDSITISGVEALTLCSTIGQLAKESTFTVDAIALPSNQASKLRCFNWKLSPGGGWLKEELRNKGCTLLNSKRPRGSRQSEVNEQLGIIENIFENTVKCSATGRLITCAFIKSNVRAPM